MELNEIRPFFTLAFKRVLQLDPAEAERAEAMEEEPDELDDQLEQDEFGYGAREMSANGHGMLDED